MKFVIREMIYGTPDGDERTTSLVTVQKIEQVKRELMLPNPVYKSARDSRRSLKGIPEFLHFYGKDGGIPRGYEERLRELFPGASWEDETLSFEPQGFQFSASLRGYQEAAVSAMEKYRQGVLCAPCGSGKTVMGLDLIARQGQPALVLVHTKDLLDQWKEAVRSFLGIEAGIIGAGKRSIGPVTLGMIQTLQRGISEEERTAFGLVMIDEAHHAPARTFFDVLQSFPARYRYGLTATPEREDGLTAALSFSFGLHQYEVCREDLQEAGLSLKPKLFWQHTNFQYCYGEDYQKMITAMTEDQPRNDIIIDLANRARDKGRTVLVLSSRVEHCEALARQISGSVLAHGGLPVKARREALEAVRDGGAQVLVASNIADEGLDIPWLDTLIMALPFRSKGKGIQRMGRILRPMEGKEEPVIVDLLDSRSSVLRRQASKRWNEIYKGNVEGVQPRCTL